MLAPLFGQLIILTSHRSDLSWSNKKVRAFQTRWVHDKKLERLVSFMVGKRSEIVRSRTGIIFVVLLIPDSCLRSMVFSVQMFCCRLTAEWLESNVFSYVMETGLYWGLSQVYSISVMHYYVLLSQNKDSTTYYILLWKHAWLFLI